MRGRSFPLLSMRFSRAGAAAAAPAQQVTPSVVDVAELAFDTLASVVRTLGDFPLEQPNLDVGSFARSCEQWAQHILVGAPAPGGDASVVAPGTSAERARRDWAGLRSFVREYCRGAVGHAQSAATDLRQVIWMFIQNLNHTLEQDQHADDRIREQMGRLERIALSAPSAELKQEVMSTVVEVSRMVEERRRDQRARVEQLGAQVRSLGAELDVARRHSEIDGLTQLFNRRAFDEYLARTVELGRAFGHESCLLMIDLDRFKVINDTFGHTMGDTVLRQVADCVSRTFLRKSDFVARYGGDEIAVVLRETSVKDATVLGERLLRSLRGLGIEREGVAVPAGASIGVARLDPKDTPATWLERADNALYRAKQSGRDQLATA